MSTSYYGGLPEIQSFKEQAGYLSSLYQKIYLGDICARNNIKNDRVLNILIKRYEGVKQPLSYNELKNVIAAAGTAHQCAYDRLCGLCR